MEQYRLKILGPLLYAICISPLFDDFVDDNFVIRWNSDLNGLKLNIQRDFELIINCLRDSGLVVNNSKTELCYFNKRDTSHISINIHGVDI